MMIKKYCPKVVNVNLKTRRGVILFSIIAILLVISLIGATIASAYLTVDISNRLIVDKTKAFYLAEAGISYAVNTLRNRAGEVHGVKETIGPIDLGEGSFTVKIDYAKSLLTSWSSVHGIKKKLQLKYTQL